MGISKKKKNKSSSASTTSNDTSSQQTDTTMSPLLIKSTFLASLGGILFGYDLGVVSGALPSLRSSLNLSSHQAETVVSFLYLGSIIGSFCGGILCDKLGRRVAILLTDVMFVLGSIVLSTAPNFAAILVGRIVVGIAVSVSAIADVSYLTEIAPEAHRGALVSCNEASISLGFLLAYISSYVITVEVNYGEGWRLMFGISGFIALIQFCGMYNMPETPVWLEGRGRHEEALDAMRRIQGRSLRDVLAEEFAPVESDDEGDVDVDDVRPLGGISRKRSDNNGVGVEMFSDEPTDSDSMNGGTTSSTSGQQHYGSTTLFRRYWRQIIIASFLAMSQQLCGHVNILNYAPEIFTQVFFGVSSSSSEEDGVNDDDYEAAVEDVSKVLAPTVVLGAVKFLGTCLVIAYVDEFGRRTLLLGGIGLIACSMLMLLLAFSTGFTHDSEDNVEENASTFQQALAVVGSVGVVAGYALSYGPLTWLITSELFPVHIRGRMLGASTILSSATAALMSYTFLSGQDIFNPAAPFVLYFTISITSFCFAAIAVPDTEHAEADEHPDEFNNLMSRLWLWRRGCRSCYRWCERRDNAVAGKNKSMENEEEGAAVLSRQEVDDDDDVEVEGQSNGTHPYIT